MDVAYCFLYAGTNPGKLNIDSMMGLVKDGSGLLVLKTLKSAVS